MWSMSLGITKGESQIITKNIYIKILEKKSTITKPTIAGGIWFSKSISFFIKKWVFFKNEPKQFFCFIWNKKIKRDQAAKSFKQKHYTSSIVQKTLKEHDSL